MSVHLTRPQVRSAVAAAVRAPSVHNTQPWLFRPIEDGIEVFADWRRQLTVSDPTGRALRVSCGAAIMNIRLALLQLGYLPMVEVNPDGDAPLGRVLVLGRTRPSPAETALFDAIGRRRSNRFAFHSTDISTADRMTLIGAAQAEGAWLSLVIGPAALELVGEMAHLADRVLTADREYAAELERWSRADPDSVDGVPRVAGGPAPEPHDLLVGRDFGGAARTPGEDFEPDPFLAVLGTFVDSPQAEVTAGQALQRVLLAATVLDLCASLASQPIDVPTVREQLRIGLHRPGPPHMVLRVGRGNPAPVTARRPVDDVLLGPDDVVPAQAVPVGLSQG